MRKSIFEQYLNNDTEARDFLNFPLQPDWIDVVGKIRQDRREPAVMDELVAQNIDSDSKAVQRNIDRLRQDNSAIIITGQQLGLFISPLYTVYKALTAIKLSDTLNKKNPDQNFVPVFWLEGEDHDFAEINHFQIPAQNGSIKKFTISNRDGERTPVARRILPKDIAPLLNNLENELQITEFSSALFKKLRRIYRAGRPWLQAFKEQMQWLFDDFGLLCFNPAAKNIKRLSVPFINNLIDKNDRFLSVVHNQSAELERNGFQNQVRLQEDYSYIFLTDPVQGRQPLFRKKTDYFLKNKDRSWSAEELKLFFAEDPTRYSSTVLTRPIWQSWLLPVASYVAGPAEIAYWTQIKPAFDVLNLTMPHLTPRNSLTLIDARIRKYLLKYDVKPESINTDVNVFIKDAVLNQRRFASLANNFDELRQQLTGYQKKVGAELQQIDPTLESPLDKTISGVKSTLSKFENRVARRIEEINENMNNHLHQIHTAILPEGKPQERTISCVYFLNKYGQKWIDKIYQAINPNHPRNRAIEL